MENFKIIIVEDVPLELKGTEGIIRNDIPEAQLIGTAESETAYWKLLKQEGYPNLAIAKTTGWDHATVWWGLDRLTNYLESGDTLAIATWQELNDILNKNDIRNRTSL